MTRRLPSLFGLLLLCLPSQALLQTDSPEISRGIRQVEEGDLEAAVVTLDAVVQRLTGLPERRTELARAHLYLGWAYLGLSQVERAKAQLKESWRNNRQMELDPKKFPLRVIQAYEEAKAEASRDDAQTQSLPAKGKGGGKGKALLIAGGLAAAGGAVALSGGSSPAATPAPVTSAPRVLVTGGSNISGPNITTRFSSFTIPAAGVIQYTGNWTLAGSSFSLQLGQNCGGFAPYAAETPVSSTPPLTLRHPVSAGEVYCPYAFYVSGVGAESFSYQIVFTAQ